MRAVRQVVVRSGGGGPGERLVVGPDARDPDGERASLTGIALHFQGSAEVAAELIGEVQAEPQAAEPSRRALIDLMEPFEDRSLIARIDADALVAHRDERTVAVGARAHVD